MLIRAKTYAEGRRWRFDTRSPKRRAYAVNFVTNGGQGTQAAIDAGYAASGAAHVSSQFLKEGAMLDAIAAEVRARPGDYAAAKAAKKLLRPSRPKELVARFRLALDKHAKLPRVVGNTIATDAQDEALRDHIATHLSELVPANGASGTEQPALPPENTETHRLGHVVADSKEEI